MKFCTKCRAAKSRDDFGKKTGSKDGLSPWCRSCLSIADRGFRSNQRTKYLIASAKGRAKQNGEPFDLDKHQEELQARLEAGFCELTGIPFDFEAKRGFNTPSIDRINPNGGYLYGNVRFICQAMNCALGNWGEEKLWLLFRGWASRREQQVAVSVKAA